MSIVDQFLAWAEYDRLRSPATLKRYRATLKQFDDPLNATREEVEAWWRTRYHLSAASRQNELACLRTFYKWAVKFELRDVDPTRRLDPPPTQNILPRPISMANRDRVFAVLRERGEDDLRRAMALGALAGLRVSEAAALDWSNVDLDSRLVYVRGKGGKERAVTASPLLLEHILPARPSGNVVTGSERVLTADALQRRANRFLESLGLNSTFHKLRGSFATEALENGSDIYAVAQVMGWSSVETAKRYISLSNRKLADVALSVGKK